MSIGPLKLHFFPHRAAAVQAMEAFAKSLGTDPYELLYTSLVVRYGDNAQSFYHVADATMLGDYRRYAGLPFEEVTWTDCDHVPEDVRTWFAAVTRKPPLQK